MSHPGLKTGVEQGTAGAGIGAATELHGAKGKGNGVLHGRNLPR